MNKFTKGAIATGAGIILLLGGAGSLAYWNSTSDVAAGTISSGTLSLSQNTTGWVDQNSVAIANINNFVIVPGDKLTFTGNYTIHATGQNLKATLAVSSAVFYAALPADLAGKLVVTFSVVAPEDTEIISADNTNPITVKVDVDFPFGATVDNTSQSDTVDLTTLDITLTQHL